MFKREFMELPSQKPDALRMALNGKKEIRGESEVGSGHCPPKYEETVRAI